MSTTNVDSTAAAELHASNLLENAIDLKDKAKTKTREILHLTERKEDEFSDDDIFSDAAFNPAKVLNKSPPHKRQPPRESVKNGLNDLKYLVSHPRRVIRSKAIHVAAEKIGSARHPIQALDRDQELLDAHDTLAQAASSGTESMADEDEMDKARERIRQVEGQRESLQTAWILGRHVKRVKVVRPIPCPQQEDYIIIENGQTRVQWERYVARLALYYTRGFTSHYIDDFKSPPFDLEDTARIIERLAITSAPWQTFLVKIRHVYTWQDPRCTAKWALLFWILWYTEHVMGYFYFYVIYSTIRNKYQASSIKRIRESVSRAFDREARVQAWGELIQRHGKQDWIEPLLDEMGPVIQRQLGDFADLLEVMVNFHRHERPDKTMASVIFFGCCLAVTLFADMAFCMKIVWFVVGSGFFLTYPIATAYPKYRLLVSHWRWIFWDIPTHAELAILQLQEKAVIRDADLKEFELRREETEGDDSESMHTDREGHAFQVYHETEGKGRLVISKTDIMFESKSSEQTWPFSSLSEMCKDDDPDAESTMKNLRKLGSRSGEVLRFIFLTAELSLLLHPSDRNRVFNLVLAWSGLKWQSLHLERQKGDRGNLDKAIKRAFY